MNTTPSPFLAAPPAGTRTKMVDLSNRGTTADALAEQQDRLNHVRREVAKAARALLQATTESPKACQRALAELGALLVCEGNESQALRHLVSSGSNNA